MLFTNPTGVVRLIELTAVYNNYATVNNVIWYNLLHLLVLVG